MLQARQVSLALDAEQSNKRVMKKTLRLMQLHLEKNQKEVKMMVFMKMRHFFEWEKRLSIISEPSSSPRKLMQSPSKTTPRKPKKSTVTATTAVVAKPAKVNKGTKLPSGFTHYLKAEEEIAASSKRHGTSTIEQSDHTTRTRKAKITASILSM